MAACSQEKVSPDALDAPARTRAAAGETVTIKATLPEVEGIVTRTELSLNDKGGIDPVWAEGDAIIVGGEVFTLLSSDGKVGTFTGKAPAGSSFDISLLDFSQSVGSLVQAASGDISHLKYSVKLEGVDSYEDVVFNYGWAAAHGGSFSQSGFLRLVLNLPERAADITSLTFSGDEISPIDLTVENGALDNHTFIAFLPCPELKLKADKEISITVNTSDGDIFVNSFYPGTQTLYGGHLITLVTSPAKWARTLSGEGSESHPFEIYTVEDFDNIRNLISENTYTYFTQMADLDFTGVEDWVPINLENKPFGIMYDGDGHKISNFKCTASTWASMFGVLHGEVKGLTIEDSEVVTTSTSPIGLVAAWCGNIDSTLQGRMDGIHVVRGKVSCSGLAYIGGLSGRSGGGTFIHCSFDGVVERTGSSTYTDTYYPVGGILGQAIDGVYIEDCHTTGSLTTGHGRSCGGVLGMCAKDLDIKDCSSKMAITARDDVAGGIVGYYGSGTLSGCSVEADIKVTEKGTSSSLSYIGGIVGNTNNSPLITRCSYKGKLYGKAGVVGGILGQSNSSTTTPCVISQCSAEGTIESVNVIGGICGRGSNTSGLTITDCASAMDITATSSYNGGVLGDAPVKTTVSRCFATGTVTGTFAIGGIIGRAFGRQGSSASLDDDVQTTVEDCIAFNKKIRTVTSGGENPASHYSGGAVIGCTSRPNTLRNCLRSSNLEFYFYNNADLNILFDHPDSSPTAPLTQAAGSAKWYSPYHGKAAAEGASVTSAAEQLGWSGTVWDFSDSVPVLKL